MIRLVVSLLGLTVIFATFAGIAYSTGALQAQTAIPPTFQLGAGETQQVRLEPTVKGTPIGVMAKVIGGPIDLFVMPKEWADRLADAGALNLSQPFSFDASLSHPMLNGTYSFSLISDGQTEYLLVLDNSEDYYLGDAAPRTASPTNGTAEVQVTIHYLQAEHRSLILGYVAAAPAVLLVALTLGHRIWRAARHE